MPHAEAEASDRGPSVSLEASHDGQQQLDSSASTPLLMDNVSHLKEAEGQESSSPELLSDAGKGTSISAVENAQVGRPNGSGSVSGGGVHSVASSFVPEGLPLPHIPRQDATRLGSCHAFANLFIVDLATVKDPSFTELVEYVASYESQKVSSV